MFNKKKNEDALTDEVSMVNKEVEKVQEEAPTMVSWKEMKALKKSKYDEKSLKYNKVYVIRNKITGMIVELRAASSLQAANFIGWRPRHTVVVKVKDIKDEIEAQEKIDGAEAEIENQKENCPALK
jgi:hypothetical protein